MANGFTAQSVCDLARSMLNDDDKVRHTDNWFMAHLVPAIDDMRRVRPTCSWGRPGCVTACRPSARER